MIAYKKYVAGWLDSSIGDFLDAFPQTFDSMKYALITCLDSNMDPASLVATSPALQSIDDDTRRLGAGLLLSTRVLMREGLAQEVFFGFDEVWFFPNELTRAKPVGLSLVGPAKVDQEKLEEVGDWMFDNSCSLALGDGCGLNFVVKAQGLVRHLLGHSLDQSRVDATTYTMPTARD